MSMIPNKFSNLIVGRYHIRVQEVNDEFLIVVGVKNKDAVISRTSDLYEVYELRQEAIAKCKNKPERLRDIIKGEWIEFN